jgi:hypothetical protein
MLLRSALLVLVAACRRILCLDRSCAQLHGKVVLVAGGAAAAQGCSWIRNCALYQSPVCAIVDV